MTETKTDTLLVEVGVEDLPGGAFLSPGERFRDVLSQELRKMGVSLREKACYSTPRRMAIQFEGVEERQSDQRVDRKGPTLDKAFDTDGKPTAAGLGFAKSCGVSPDELSREDGRLVYHGVQPGRTLEACLNECLPVVFREWGAKRRMRWGREGHEFVRPVRWLCAMHGGKVLDVSLFGCQSEARSYGHRCRHPGEVRLQHANDYEKALKQAGVMARHEARRQKIEAAYRMHARVGGGAPIPVSTYTLAGLTEFPDSLLVPLDKNFLEMPHGILWRILSKDFNAMPIFVEEEREDGRAVPTDTLRPEFVAITDTKITDDNEATIRRGYEQVARARLADVEFFYKRDLKRTLESRIPELREVIFEKHLGTLYDKTQRIARIGAHIADKGKFIRTLPGEVVDRGAPDKSAVKRAASLCKCELVTELIKERPDMEGFVGHHYAHHEGLDERVVAAMAGTATSEGQALFLADQLDTLVGIFSTGHRPTGDSDPYGLRRAALAVVRILVWQEVVLELEPLLRKVHGWLPPEAQKVDGAELALAYIYGRLPAYYRDERLFPPVPLNPSRGVQRQHPVDAAVLPAVLAAHPPTLVDLDQRMQQLDEFMQDPRLEDLIASNKRIANILRKQDAEDLNETGLTGGAEQAEQALHACLKKAQKSVPDTVKQRNYKAALEALAEFAEPLETFFDKVLVMSDDQKERTNRLKLLCAVRRLFLSVADFSKLSGRTKNV